MAGKKDIIQIQGINFVRSGAAKMTRDQFNSAYGIAYDGKGKQVKKYWNKSEKQLDEIWGKLQDKLGRKEEKPKKIKKKKSKED